METTYGELTENGVRQMMHRVPKKNKVLADLGSGKGRVVVAMARFYPELKKVIGVEFLEDRHNTALENVAALPVKKRKKISLIKGDIFEQNFGKMDIVYCSNLCFRDEMNQRLSEKFSREMHGGSIIFANRRLNMARPVKVETVTVEQSWNHASTIFKHTLL